VEKLSRLLNKLALPIVRTFSLPEEIEMSIARNLTLFLCVLYSAHSLASSPYEGLEFGKYKQQITADLKKTCHPQKKMSDEVWGNKVLSNEDNKRSIRDARIALERNNEKNYWDAISKVECPEM